MWRGGASQTQVETIGVARQVKEKRRKAQEQKGDQEVARLGQQKSASEAASLHRLLLPPEPEQRLRNRTWGRRSLTFFCPFHLSPESDPHIFRGRRR